jgi:uncharacterized protein YndB with AHSA1/START domain
MSQSESVSVRREIVIAAPPDVVWEYLVNADLAAGWMGQEVELDPRPGGIYRVQVIPGNTARGEFVTVEPPHRLVYTFGWEPGENGTVALVQPGASTVEIQLEPREGSTLVRIHHRDLPTDQSAESHAAGWDHYLERLVAAASGGDPGRDSWLPDA